MLQTSKHHI